MLVLVLFRNRHREGTKNEAAFASHHSGSKKCSIHGAHRIPSGVVTFLVIELSLVDQESENLRVLVSTYILCSMPFWL